MNSTTIIVTIAMKNLVTKPMNTAKSSTHQHVKEQQPTENAIVDVESTMTMLGQTTLMKMVTCVVIEFWTTEKFVECHCVMHLMVVLMRTATISVTTVDTECVDVFAMDMNMTISLMKTIIGDTACVVEKLIHGLTHTTCIIQKQTTAQNTLF